MLTSAAGEEALPLFASETCKKSCGNRAHGEVLLYHISLNDRQPEVGSQKIHADFKHSEDDISEKEKNTNLTLETRTCGTCLAFSFGIDKLKSTRYCLQLAERFNHLYSRASIDCIWSLKDIVGGLLRIQDVVLTF